jgi:hypothetical protein
LLLSSVPAMGPSSAPSSPTCTADTELGRDAVTGDKGISSDVLARNSPGGTILRGAPVDSGELSMSWADIARQGNASAAAALTASNDRLLTAFRSMSLR